MPIIEEDCILLLGYSTLYMKHNLTGFNHQKKRYSGVANTGAVEELWILGLQRIEALKKVCAPESSSSNPDRL